MKKKSISLWTSLAGVLMCLIQKAEVTKAPMQVPEVNTHIEDPIWFGRTAEIILQLATYFSVFLIMMLFFTSVQENFFSTTTADRVIAVIIGMAAVFFALRYRKLFQVESKERKQLQALVANANEGILLVSKNGNISVANPAANKIFGYSDSELVGANINELISKEDGEGKSEYFDDFIHAPSARPMERALKGRRKNGDVFFIDISLSYFFNANELKVIVFVLDATERRMVELLNESYLESVKWHNIELEEKVRRRTAELEITNKQLLNSQILYKAMAHNFPDGVIGVMDRNMKYVLVDGKGLKELGLDAAHLAGDGLFNHIHSAITNYAEGALQRVFNGENVSFDLDIENRYYNVSSVPIHTPGHGINEILVVVKNVSAQKNLERELIKTLAKEKELNTLKSRFVTMASHEFRTPLTTILSSAFLLENYTGVQLQVEKQKHLDRIKRSVHGLTELLNEFLSLGKLEEGVVQVSYKPVELKSFIEELVQEIVLVKKDDQKIVFEYDGPNTEIMADKQLLRNILINLLSNAIKYSSGGATIRLYAFIGNGMVKLKVTDQGIGIPVEEQKFIFKRFFRANNTSDIQGTGIGLNIVKRYVRLMKGKIEFTSKVDKGTSFTVTLPLQYA